MTQVTVDTSMVSQLLSSPGKVEILDPKGNVIGHFSPIAAFDLSEFKGLSETELQDALQQPTKTTAEVLQFLENLK